MLSGRYDDDDDDGGDSDYYMPAWWSSACHIILVGGLSAADWNARRVDGDGSKPASSAAPYTVQHVPPSGLKRRRNELQVLENRDLCRIVASFIPKTT